MFDYFNLCDINCYRPVLGYFFTKWPGKGLLTYSTFIVYFIFVFKMQWHIEKRTLTWVVHFVLKWYSTGIYVYVVMRSKLHPKLTMFDAAIL